MMKENSAFPKYKAAGFTLVEVLVSIVITAIVIVAVMASMWHLVLANHQADALRQLHKQVHFSLVRSADKIRTHSIDYTQHPEDGSGTCAPLPGGMTAIEKICLGDGHILEFRDKNLFLDDSPLFGDAFEVESVGFLVSPTKAPSDNIADKSTQLQPKVTIHMSVRSRAFSSAFMEVQTTISSRRYTP